MSTAQQQIYQQIQLLPMQERLQLIRRLFAEAVKTEQFQLAGSMTVNGEIDEMTKQQRAAMMATLEARGAQLRAELAE
ncbi:MAG: hypothetical protein HYR56_02430 [Acidobacteria bacterium]|nr:hypothetical protein [Acidobacteriota bacterium]MBI3424827.1 hypothetical protein [Acidobacteriota bacterium]